MYEESERMFDMLKILHIGDVHLGLGYKSKDEYLQSILKGSISRAFENAVEFGIDRDIDLFIIAGDLFDFGPVSPRDFDFFISMVEKLKTHGIQVIYTLGNHDNKGIFHPSLLRAMSEKLILFKDIEPKVVEIETKHGEMLSICGTGHDKDAVGENAVQRFKKGSGKYNIGVAHCYLGGTNIEFGEDRYMPTSLSDIRTHDFDYFAMGHIHKPEIFLNGKAAYSGSVQGLSFKESGDRGGVYVVIDEHGTTTEHVGFHMNRYESVEIEADENINDHMQLIGHITKELESRLEKKLSKNDLLRIFLTGGTSREIINLFDNDKKYVEDQIRNHLEILHVEINTERLTEAVPPEDIMGQEHFLSYCLSMMEGQKDDIMDMFAENLKRIGIEAEDIPQNDFFNDIKNTVIDSLYKR